MHATGSRSPSPRPIVLAECWRRFTRDGDRKARDQLVLAYSPLVKQIAGHVAGRMPAHVDIADLVSYGLVGLVAAIERFDPSRGVKFESFAGQRIRGAIVDELRVLDWVPRAVRQEGRAVEHATATLLTRFQRLPTDAELAGELHLDATELDHVLQRVETSRMLALDEPRHFSTTSSAAPATLLDTLAAPATDDPASTPADADLRERVAVAVARLSPREQAVLTLRYRQELTFGDIGDVFALSESRISQIHTKAMVNLRAQLSAPAAAAAR